MHWRENINEIVANKEFDKLHILTHPFWYHENEQSMADILSHFVDSAKKERYFNMKENIRDLEGIFQLGD